MSDLQSFNEVYFWEQFKSLRNDPLSNRSAEWNTNQWMSQLATDFIHQRPRDILVKNIFKTFEPIVRGRHKCPGSRPPAVGWSGRISRRSIRFGCCCGDSASLAFYLVPASAVPLAYWPLAFNTQAVRVEWRRWIIGAFFSFRATCKWTDSFSKSTLDAALFDRYANEC